MKNWQEVEQEFKQFGYALLETRYSMGKSGPDEYTITLYLMPDRLPDADVSTSAGVRRACFELAEQAIAYVEANYTLANAPHYETYGDVHWEDWLNGKYTIVTSATLNFIFTDKRGT